MAIVRKFAPEIGLLAFLALSRLVVRALGLAPDPDIVIDHWQHIDLNLLASDPLGSLWALHSQPPLWNGILAVAVALVGPDGGAVTNLMYGFNLVLTAGAALLILSVLRRFGFPHLAATAFTALAMCSPNVFYFETYVFYPHFTFFLVTLLIWLLVQVRREGPLWPVAGALGVLVVLSWTWAIFHPAFVALCGAGLFVWRCGWTLKPVARPMIAMAVLAALLASLPTVKNLAVHGVPSASTWIGLNLAQTIPGGQSGALVQCDFDIAHADAVAAGPVSPSDHTLLTQAWKRPGWPNMNHAGMIETSKQCFEMTKTVILRDPLRWLGFRFETMLGSHQLAPSNYGADPLGWDAVFGFTERAADALGAAGRTIMLLWYLALVWFGLKSVRSDPPLYLSLLGVIAYFTLASHLLNGGEQARMRYTIEPIYLVFSAGLLASLVRWLAARWPLRRAEPSQAGA